VLFAKHDGVFKKLRLGNRLGETVDLLRVFVYYYVTRTRIHAGHAWRG
jgi:hypothetical protein